ncbi:MAG: hypothetical protein SPF18_00930 [Blautia sp.]|nr:hypothetical protein [Blautia sp.]
MISGADGRKIFERFPSIATGISSDHGLMEAKFPSIGGAGNLKNRRVCDETCSQPPQKNLAGQMAEAFRFPLAAESCSMERNYF